MKIITNTQDKIVEIWITNKEKHNLKLKQALSPLFAEYKKQKYTVAVFYSGESNLLANTTDLLLKNKFLKSA